VTRRFRRGIPSRRTRGGGGYSSGNLPPLEAVPARRRRRTRIEEYRGDILQDVFRVGTIKNAEAITAAFPGPGKCRNGPTIFQRVVQDRVGSRPERTVGVQQLLCVERPLPQPERAGRSGTAVSVARPSLVGPGPRCPDPPSHGSSFPLALQRGLQSDEHFINIQKVAEHSAGNQSLDPEQGVRHRPPRGPGLRSRAEPRGPPVRPHDRREAAEELANNVNCGQQSGTGGGNLPSPGAERTCGECRACWSPSVPNIAYRLH